MPWTPAVPEFFGNVNFNAQHSPMGAFMSFTCGHFNSGGGIGVEIGRPAEQGLIIGVQDGPAGTRGLIRSLPFMRPPPPRNPVDIGPATLAREAELAKWIKPYESNELKRHYGWGTDTWVAGDLSFSVYTPFGSIPDPASATRKQMRDALLPAVIASLRVDNRGGTKAQTAIFAIDFGKPGARVLRRGADRGFAWRRGMGVMGRSASGGPAPFAFQRWSVLDALGGRDPVHALGTTGGLALEVPPGQIGELTLAIGVYLEGFVTTGIDARYLYTRYYSGLDDVLFDALDRSDDLHDSACELDRKLLASGLSHEQQFLIAHSTRSYYGSTQLLDAGGEPFWVVNEGEYCMMNTLDLCVDQVFWELERNPWVVRNVLDNFAKRYAYVDELAGEDGRSTPGGMSFAHDMGAHNNFSSPGNSAYEMPHLTDCFSYMTAEELCNYILTAACYTAKTGDAPWLASRSALIGACLDSLIARTGASGMIEFDSARCDGGHEITTYDSLDPSLAQTRNNVYMAVKCWASFLGLALLADAIGDRAAFAKAGQRADRVALTVAENAGSDGVLPAIFEAGSPGYSERILPAAEGLIYPFYWREAKFRDKALNALLSSDGSVKLIDALRRHVRVLLLDPERRNVFADGGLKLSSKSENSWMSKIALFQHIVRNLFDTEREPEIRELFANADAAHVKWQTDGGGIWACSDQFLEGRARWSRYYPRVITSALWLKRHS